MGGIFSYMRAYSHQAKEEEKAKKNKEPAKTIVSDIHQRRFSLSLLLSLCVNGPKVSLFQLN